jgi:cytochrome P450
MEEHVVSYQPAVAKQPDPWAEIAADRAVCPVAHVAAPSGLEYFQVSGYDLVKSLMANHAVFSNAMGVTVRGPEAPKEQVLTYADPPAHTRQRKLITRAFSRAKVNEEYERILEVTHGLVDEIVASGRTFDLQSDFARKLPSQIVAKILGVPIEDQAQFIRWAEDVERMSVSLAVTPERQQIMGDFSDYVRELLARRRSDPRDDLLSEIANASVNGDSFTDIEAAAMVRLVLLAGNSTTSLGIVNTVMALETHPDEKAKLLASLPEVAESAVEEGLRWDCPVHGNFRGAVRDAELNGVPIPAGSKVWGMYSGANHDPAAYADPDQFRIDRDWRAAPPHLAFGWGIHLCPGAALARSEMGIALRILYGRLAGLRLRAGFVPTQLMGLQFRGWERLEMTYDHDRGATASGEVEQA